MDKCCLVSSSRPAKLCWWLEARKSTALAGEFAGAAQRYWLRVFPRVCREVGQWRGRAWAIPDPVLRQSALENLLAERLNLDGAAAFAAFAPAARRPAVVRAQVAFQAAYDYVDTLAEQDNPDPVRNGDRLHRALLAALDPAPQRIDYYAHHAHNDDAGYLEYPRRDLPRRAERAPILPLGGGCRRVEPLRESRPTKVSIRVSARGDHAALERWARERRHPQAISMVGDAASAGSSLGVFMLIATAAEQAVRAEDAAAIEEAYFPWIGSLHTLLDSLVDRHEDVAAGQSSLLAYYASPEEAAARLGAMAVESMRQDRGAPHGCRHALVLAGMAGHYLSMPEATLPEARLATRSVLAAIGGLAAPAMLVMGVRRALGADDPRLRIAI